jgi:ABC-2 type transport system permease protein
VSTSAIERTIGTGRTLPPGRYGITGLLWSEWTKLRTVRSTMWTLGILIVLGIGISALASAETAAHWSRMSPSAIATFDATQTSLIGLYFAQFVIGILGVLVVSAEYSTGTIRATLSAAPRRPLVLGAKAAVFGGVALVVAETVSFVAYFVGQALLSSPATHTNLGDPGALRAVVGAGLYLCVLGLFALGLATIIRHTAGAICAFVGVLLVLPIIISALPSSIGNATMKYLPGSIGNAMISQSAGANSFAPWPGFALLCAYAAGTLVIGGMLLTRRDA